MANTPNEKSIVIQPKENEINKKTEKVQMSQSSLHLPKATNTILRQVFWLVLFWQPSHLWLHKQWREYAKTRKGLTATGIAPDLNRIPF